MSNQQRNQNNASPAKKGGKKNKKKEKIQQSPISIQRQQPQKAVAAAYATGSVGKGPTIKANQTSSRIVNRELLGNVVGHSAAFTVELQFGLNPGLATSFPWLSTQAVGWEKYRFRYLRFRYLTRSASTDKGSIILSPDHDAADAPPQSEVIACSYQGATEDAPWKDQVCHIRCDNTARFNRSGSLNANLDIKTYDLGNMFVCSSGMSTDGASYGKLFVEYDVELLIPQLPANTISPLGGSVTGGGTLSAAVPLGTAPTVNPLSNGVFNTLSGSTFSIDQIGTYLMSMSTNGTGVTAAGAPTLASGIASIASAGNVNGAGSLGFLKSEINVTGAPAVFNLPGIVATTVTASHLDVARAPTNSL